MDGNPGDGRELPDRIPSPEGDGYHGPDRHSSQRGGSLISWLQRACERFNLARRTPGRGSGHSSQRSHQPDITHIQRPLHRAEEIAQPSSGDGQLVEVTNDHDDASIDTASTGQPCSACPSDDWEPRHHSGPNEVSRDTQPIPGPSTSSHSVEHLRRSQRLSDNQTRASSDLPNPVGGAARSQGSEPTEDPHTMTSLGKPLHRLTEKQKKKLFFIEALRTRYKVDYEKVQPIPYIKDRLHCVDKVYVEGGFEFMPTEHVTRGSGSWERLESYKSLFSDQRIQSVRRIIEGEPGYGKTTFTLQLAYDWCHRVEGSPMQDVEVLIILRMRQLSGIRSIYRAIEVHLLGSDPRVREADIAAIIRESKSAVVILDGYDEYPDQHSRRETDVQRILKLTLFENTPVILTTRYLPDYLAPITKIVRLTGFDERARDEYIRKAVVGEDKFALSIIKARLKENPVLEDLCQVPLIFVMFAHIAYENQDFQNFKSVTEFFRYMIRCFHEHLKNKSKELNTVRYSIDENEHAALDKLAFLAISQENQRITWSREGMCKQLGQEFYETYQALGIFVEEEVVSYKSSREVEVRFYHKLFCEWYAAHHIVYILSQPGHSVSLEELFRHMKPEDVQYVYRFACGLNRDVGSSIIQYLSDPRGTFQFRRLCILEQSGDVESILGSVRSLCSGTVIIKGGDSRLLQRSTVQLLDIAATRDILVSSLHLDQCFSKFDVTNACIVLKSGIRLTNLKTVKVLRVSGRIRETVGDSNGIVVNGEELLGLFRSCEPLEEIRFEGREFQLPHSLPADMIPPTLKTRNIMVSYEDRRGMIHQLKWDDGQWQTTTYGPALRIPQEELNQQWALEELAKPSTDGIPISCLHLDRCFSKFDVTNACIFLTSGLRLTSLKTVKVLHVEGFTGTGAFPSRIEVTREELLGLLQTCKTLEEIRFVGWEYHLPLSVPAELIPPTMKTRNIKVSYERERKHGVVHQLNWDDGQWQHQITSDGSVRVNIFQEELDQQWGKKELAVLSTAEVSINRLYLDRSFSNITDDTQAIILTSACTIPVLQTLRQLRIRYTDVDLEMFLKILAYTNECTKITQLVFRYCDVPNEVDPEMIPPPLKQRGVEVKWLSKAGKLHLLDFNKGSWKRLRL